jgi:hypothetical protein
MGIFDFFRNKKNRISNSNEDITLQDSNVKSLHEKKLEVNNKIINNYNLTFSWVGILGKNAMKNQDGENKFMSYFATTMTFGERIIKNNIDIAFYNYEDIIFKGIEQKNKTIAFLPIVKTENVQFVDINEIHEFENAQRLIALITGTSKDTFGLTYLATDYAENKEVYNSKNKLQIKISGIAIVLDICSIDEIKKELNYNEDYTNYIPNSDLPNHACFDFIGQLENYKETFLLDDKSLKGYILKVKLITNQDKENSFTIDIFVTPENMRFQELVIGMKLKGLFQMQGHINE